MACYFLLIIQQESDSTSTLSSSSHEECGSDSNDDIGGTSVLLEDHFNHQSVVWNLLWFLFLWQSAFHVTERALKHIMHFLKYFVKIIGLAYQNDHLVTIGDQIPIKQINVKNT